MLHSTAYAHFINRRQERLLILALVVLWLILQSYWFWKHGVRVMGDSEAYIEYAQNIAKSFQFENNFRLRYVGYPLFMALILKAGLSLPGVIVMQIILSGFATIALYKSTKTLAQNNLAPLLATALFICWYDLQMFNGFILTESLYISLILISFYLIVKTKKPGYALYILPLLLYIASIRPNGFIVLIAYLGYLFFSILPNIKSRQGKFFFSFATISLVILILIAVNKYLLSYFGGIVETYEKGQLIFMYDELTIKPSKPIIMPPDDASSFMKLVLFIKYNTSYFFEMAGMRFLLFWGNIKPFFSTAHNLMIVMVLYPLYFFTIKVLLSRKLATPIKVFVFLLLAQQAFITTMTSEDWNGRFLMSVIAFIFSLGTIGTSWQLLNYWKKPVIK